MQVTDAVHVDGRDRLAPALGQGQPLPAFPDPARGGPEPAVEVPGGVHGAHHRVELDHLQAQLALAGHPECGHDLVERQDEVDVVRFPAQPLGQPGQHLAPPGTLEVVLDVGPGEPGISGHRGSHQCCDWRCCNWRRLGPARCVTGAAGTGTVVTGTVVPGHVGDLARRGLEVEELPPGHVPHERAAELVVAAAGRIRVHVPVQQQGRPQPSGEDVQGGKTLVHRVRPVAHAARRGMGQQHVQPVWLPAARPAAKLAQGHPVQPDPGGEPPGPAGLLPVGVLVWPGAVAAAAAQAGDPEAGHVHHPAVRADRPVRPRRPGREPGAQGQAGPADAVPGQVRIVIAGHEDQRHVESVHQIAQVLERQVAAAQDEVGAAHRADVGPQAFLDHVGDGQDAHHTVIVRCELVRTGSSRWISVRRFP